MSQPKKSSERKSKSRKMDSYSLKDESYFHASVCANLVALEDGLRRNESSGLSKIYNNFYVPFKHKEDLKGKFYKQVRLVNNPQELSIVSLFQNKRYAECLYTGSCANYISFLPRDVQDYRDTRISPQELPELLPTKAIFAHLQPRAWAPAPSSHESEQAPRSLGKRRPQHHSSHQPDGIYHQHQHHQHHHHQQQQQQQEHEHTNNNELQVKLEPDFPGLSLPPSATKSLACPEAAEHWPRPFEFGEVLDFDQPISCKVEEDAGLDFDYNGLLRLDNHSPEDQDEAHQL